MSVKQTLVNSFLKVGAGIVGFGLFFAGAQWWALSDNPLGAVVTIVGVVLMVFAAKL